MLEPNRFKAKFLNPKYWLTWLWLGIAWLISWLPYSCLMWLGRAIGKLMYCLAGRRKHIAKTNIALCFPELTSDEQEQMLKNNFVSMGMSLLEVGMAWWWPKWRLAKLSTIDGLEHLQQQEGKGTLLLAMHFSTLEIGAALLGREMPIDGMYRKHKNPVFDYIQRQGRENYHPSSQTIPRKEVRTMLKALRQGRTVWYAPDQDYGPKQSIFVPFFGVTAATVTATAKFAKLGKAKVVPFVQHRREDGKGYHVQVLPPLENFPTDDEEADAVTVNKLIEMEIRKRPDQYMWLHRRFKTRPEGEAKIY
ncbi:LpxL/LpxP family Kdo(2)-lipid IV(A) lauroyl/palmitoleoyl acyltransferase [Spartinivicinus marinus]|uniref:LpxL/LpxP family Kdo(2)-lipid IV(A) lauroyl/palmitoleoyl acyltransferase n=1 Tax=Spartinivicinus marinus TaxID=2994442 RepID=UPI001C5CC078|nr:LpxL/LpxP family Kdo(2)-lipid IV(A) lauroyl/palmitoleoyl acyltransferase [Spartinivicinus marinus]MCX4028759.1 LpxL/LpxP family Kdo(2)-lipid IV(A) lauroyl/palmitoleoyl acyltransferase [Spartinivicinus marinus]